MMILRISNVLGHGRFLTSETRYGITKNTAVATNKVKPKQICRMAIITKCDPQGASAFIGLVVFFQLSLMRVEFISHKGVTSAAGGRSRCMCQYASWLIDFTSQGVLLHKGLPLFQCELMLGNHFLGIVVCPVKQFLVLHIVEAFHFLHSTLQEVIEHLIVLVEIRLLV